MMLDRKKQPEFGRIEDINLQEPKVVHLDNGIPVLCIDAGTQNVLKIELVFDAGTSTANKILVASTAVKTLTEGTSNRTAKEIAESVDFYGSYLQNEVSHDESSICLYSLNKHLDKTLATLAEVYSTPTFPTKEIETVLKKSQQEMLVNQEKVSYLGAKAFSSALYGKDHPYGRSADVEDYDKIGPKDLANFHASRVKNSIKYILVAGKLGEDTVSNLNTFFGSEERIESQKIDVDGAGIEPSSIHVNKENAVQN
ncbi:MAG: M16 family metallopeptidase, partial [Flavobacteriales bacterium]